MSLPIIIFFVVCGLVLGVAGLLKRRSVAAASQALLRRRLSEVAQGAKQATSNLSLIRQAQGTLPALDRLVGATRAGSWLAQMIEQAGMSTTPGTIVAICAATALGAALVALLLVRQWFAMPVAGVIGACIPIWWVKHKRSARLKRFEEQFAEALELLSRALRAGHAFQTALGMAATELKWPAGGEFKKTFDEQNFGLPLRDALTGMATRMPLLDVRFFVTAVLIQRETGGNLAEILDNLARVVRERFMIQRQVRTHSAHGRFTGYVLLALPAFLGVALSIINPEHMGLLFREHMGQIMLGGAMVLQIVGYFWIRQVIKIEV